MARRGVGFKRDYAALTTVTSDLKRRIRNAGMDPKSVDLDTLQLPWYDVKNEANTDDTEVFIYDEIGGWFGTPVEDFVKELNGIKTKSITVRINSPGGSLFDSIAIYNTLVKHNANVTVYVDALAASGASIIAMAGDKTIMMVGSQLMIHDALGVEIGNAADMRAMAKFLDGQSENIATIYKAKAGSEPEGGWRKLMLAETWMFAEEAVALGLADEVYSTIPDNAFPATDPDESEEDEDEEGEEESTEDSEESTEDSEEDDEIENLMKHDHTTVNHGWKFANRRKAPAPPVVSEWEQFVNSILT